MPCATRKYKLISESESIETIAHTCHHFHHQHRRCTGGGELFSSQCTVWQTDTKFWPVLANLGYFVANLSTLWHSSVKKVFTPGQEGGCGRKTQQGPLKEETCLPNFLKCTSTGLNNADTKNDKYDVCTQAATMHVC